MDSTVQTFLLMTSMTLAVIGFLVVSYLGYRVAVAVYRARLRPARDLKKRYGHGWAVVTGATDGIGKAVAWQLAKRGMKVLLVSRTQSKLDATAQEIHEKFPSAEIRALQIDFSNFDGAAQARVETVFTELNQTGGVAILVNNVGVSYDFPVYFHELSEDRVTDLIKLNIDSTTYMTKLALKFMLERKGAQKRGAIVNIGSTAGVTSSPLLTQYSAAKAYVQRFSEGLAVEYASRGIDVQVHVPSFIVSKLSKFRKSSFMIPSAELYGKLVCDRIGYEAVVNPYLPHSMMSFVMENAPTYPREAFTLSLHLGIRAKGLKKQGNKEDEKKHS